MVVQIFSVFCDYKILINGCDLGNSFMDYAGGLVANLVCNLLLGVAMIRPSYKISSARPAHYPHPRRSACASLSLTAATRL